MSAHSVIGRRGFFTVVGAALAAVKVANAAHGDDVAPELDIPVLVVSPGVCILCGFDQMLSPWSSERHPGVMRCTDRMGCQSRQIDALLGTLTPWQRRTGVIMAKGQQR